MQLSGRFRPGMTWLALSMLCLLAPFMTGCAGGKGTDSFCAVMGGPILVDTADALTDQTARRILTVDMTGEKLCGW